MPGLPSCHAKLLAKDIGNGVRDLMHIILSKVKPLQTHDPLKHMIHALLKSRFNKSNITDCVISRGKLFVTSKYMLFEHKEDRIDMVCYSVGLVFC